MVRVRVTVTFRVTPIRTVLRLGYSLGYGYGDVSRHIPISTVLRLGEVESLSMIFKAFVL